MNTSIVSTIIGLIALLTLQIGCHRKVEQDTLTLEGDKIILRTTSKTDVVMPIKIGNDILGAKLVKFEPKSLQTNGKEIDISELTLENQSDGSRLVLVEYVPLKVFWDDHTSTWKPMPTK